MGINIKRRKREIYRKEMVYPKLPYVHLFEWAETQRMEFALTLKYQEHKKMNMLHIA